MDAWKSNLESVIQKWEKKGPPAHIFDQKPSEKYSVLPSVRQNGNSRSTRKRLKPANRYKHDRIKEREYWASLEFSQTPKKFKLMSPVIKPPRAPYQMYQCIKCQKICRNGSLHRTDTNPLSLFNVINISDYARRKSITCWFAPDMAFILSRKTHKYPNRVLSAQDNECGDDGSKGDLKVLEDKSDQQNIRETSQVEILSRYKNLISYINTPITRITSWLVLKLFRRHFSSLCCQRQDIVVLEEAAKKNIPIIFLPICTSLMDFVIIYFTLFLNNIRLPFTFIQGDAYIGSITRFILRRLGVSFVAEPGSSTTVSSTDGSLLRKHVKELLKDNQSLQISVVGQNVYNVGDQNMASFMIQNVAQCVIEGVVADAVIVPINVTYEKGCDFTLADLWNMPKLLWRGLKSNFNGMAHIRFGYPTSFQDFRSREPKFPSLDWSSFEEPSSYNCVSLSSLDKITCSLLNHVVSDCHTVGVITCTSMLSLLLTTKHKSEVSIEDLEISFDWLTQEVNDSNRHIGFFGATADVVNYGLNLLSSQQLIQFNPASVTNSKASRTVSPVQDFEKRDRLLEHAHQVTQVFILKSIVATSVIAIAGGANLFRIGQYVHDEISRNEILSLSKHLCRILRSQYIIFPPCTDIMTSLSDTLDSFIASGILTISKDWQHSNQPRSMALDFGDEYFDDDILNNHESDIRFEVSATEEERDLILFWHSLISPTLEKIWFVAACLSEAPFKKDMTVDGFVCSVRERFIKRVLRGHTLCVSGGDVHNSFIHIANVLVVFGLLEEIRDEQIGRKLKTPFNIEHDDEYIDFMRKLENCL